MQKELERLRALDQREIKRLKQELRRKEKALAEAAALLIASKRVRPSGERTRTTAHLLSEEERQWILLTCKEREFAALLPGQTVAVLADRGLYIGSVRSFYRVSHAHGQVHRRGRARQPQEPRPVPRLRAAVRIRCGALTSPISRPPCAVCGFTFIW